MKSTQDCRPCFSMPGGGWIAQERVITGVGKNKAWARALGGQCGLKLGLEGWAGAGEVTV